jgi:hypothetical protein
MMPMNTGIAPRRESVDLRFRNGHVRRGVNPKHWRWKPWDWGQSDFDILEWQASK